MNSHETYFPEVSAELLEQFCSKYHIKSLSLFGSQLHRDATAASDIDLLVEFEPEHTPGFLFAQIQQELSQLLGKPVDLHTPYSISKYFRETVVKEAAAIYGRS
jgi:uncharacterized protein